MSAKIIILLAAVCSVALGDRNPYSYNAPEPRQYTPPRPTYNAPAPSRYQSDESYEDPKYDFDWQVNEEYNNFNQEETRDGDNTQGSYTVNLPDGRRQTVTYYVDGDSGFVAEVSYSGEARYPESREYSAPRPSYNPPRPAYEAPRTTPRPAYQAPRTTPRQTYQAPRTTPRPSYQPPRQTYKAPARSNLLAAYGF